MSGAPLVGTYDNECSRNNRNTLSPPSLKKFPMLPPNSMMYVFQIDLRLLSPSRAIMMGEIMGPPPMPPAYARPTTTASTASESTVVMSVRGGSVS